MLAARLFSIGFPSNNPSDQLIVLDEPRPDHIVHQDTFRLSSDDHEPAYETPIPTRVNEDVQAVAREERLARVDEFFLWNRCNRAGEPCSGGQSDPAQIKAEIASFSNHGFVWETTSPITRQPKCD